MEKLPVDYKKTGMENHDVEKIDDVDRDFENLIKEFYERYADSVRRELFAAGKNNFEKRAAKRGEPFDLEDLNRALDEEMEKEMKFSESVLSAYFRWAKENNPVALWDVDIVMGTINYVGNTARWGFRSSLIPLFSFLGEKFPEIKNGILSSRSNVAMEDQLKDPLLLGRINSFIDRDSVYSSRSIAVSPEQDSDYDKLLDEFRENQGQCQFTYDTRQKLTLIKKLKEDGKNVKIIDDDAVAYFAGDDGVLAYSYAPDRNFVR